MQRSHFGVSDQRALNMDPELQQTVQNLLVWGLYPGWLVAGAGDYLCHRQTDIEHTSGSKESWFHVWEFGCLLIAFSAAVLLRANIVVFSVIAAAVLVHSVLAFLDVSFTDGRRYISPVEQHVHGYMEVLPFVAVALFGALHWPAISAELHGPIFALHAPIDVSRWLLLGSFAVFGGVPILEELTRTYRHRAARERRLQAGLATIK